MQKDRTARAEMKKQLFMQQLATKQSSVKHEHDYVLVRGDPVPLQQGCTSERRVN